ncbi:homeobox protein ath1 [Arabis alpina]|uniref:Homeobox protein ath1 n=1 Tax=Arabis alpina TaxID=50452 RepID=A0A087GJ64_ARAAL|nr:homeobox protein ath1 [Arabis alpina]
MDNNNNNTFSSLDNVMTNQNPLLMDLIPSREDSTSFSTMLPWNSIRSSDMGGFDIFNSLLTNKYLSSTTSSSINVQENRNIESFDVMALPPPPPPLHHLDHLRPYDDSSNNMWSFGGNSEFQAYSCVEGDVGPSEPIMSTFGEEDFPFLLSNKRNELSLSLATDVSDECSEISLCAATKSTRIASEQASCSSKDISNNVSQVIFGSKYLHSVQEILSHFATYSLDGLENCPQRYSIRGTESGAYYENVNEFTDGGFNNSEAGLGSISQRRALEAKKTHLLDLLQMVDDRYSHCVDEIHTVVSAFHAATELDPQLHTRFALRTISFLYKNLRERISKKILAMGSVLERGKEKSSENSIFHQHCLLQQLKRKNHQIWRPQRGLPEKSVSVLRTWMFQNFLHPYPKDSEKHLLAIRSGLTRSQVLSHSNSILYFVTYMHVPIDKLTY